MKWLQWQKKRICIIAVIINLGNAKPVIVREKCYRLFTIKLM
ncbi:MAG: hypothetical protein V1932_04080 [Chloroflexota bacterium]